MRILIALLLWCFSAAMADGLPELGEASRKAFSPYQEKQVGENIMREIRADRSYIDDPELTDYINELGYRLIANTSDSSQNFEFFIVKDSSLNAFALPGGYIGVHSGLILAAQSESELAAVLAHEVAHVTQKHLARLISVDQDMSLATLAAMAVAILASSSNPQLSNAAAAAAQATSIQTQINYTRDYEKEADRIGMQTLSRAGFDPRAIAVFFGRLQQSSRAYDNNAPAYLRTHPLTTERIADIQNRIQDLPYKQIPNSREFQFMRAKIRSIQERPSEAVVFFDANLRERRFDSEVAQRYGLVYALLRAKNYVRADKELTVLRKMAPSIPEIDTLAGELALAQGRPEKAVTEYQNAHGKFPAYRPLLYGYLDSLMRTKRLGEALKLSANELRNRPNDDRLHELQAKIYAGLGKVASQHQAQAEAYARRGNLTAAIEQLQLASKSKDADFYQLSVIEARLRQLTLQDADTRKPK